MASVLAAAATRLLAIPLGLKHTRGPASSIHNRWCRPARALHAPGRGQHAPAWHNQQAQQQQWQQPTSISAHECGAAVFSLHTQLTCGACTRGVFCLICVHHLNLFNTHKLQKARCPTSRRALDHHPPLLPPHSLHTTDAPQLTSGREDHGCLAAVACL